jgi:two-component system LytT family response regulator
MTDTISCLIVDDEPVARNILKKHLAAIESIRVVAECKNAIEAFNLINEENIDLIFLDINMPSISGLSFAKSINRDIKVIFTTAYREFAVDGFDLKAVDYLLKPISFERLLQAVNKYIDENKKIDYRPGQHSEKGKSDHFFVRSDRKMVKVCFEDIQFIESIGDYVKIYLSGRKVVTREKISSIEVKLPQKDFIRTHRSFIVSLAKIESFTSEYIEIGKKQLPVSRSYKDIVMERLGGQNTG